MSYSKFLKDLNNGLYYETELIKHIPHIKYTQSQGIFKEYDLKIYHQSKRYNTYEVKSDKQINIYGNICIEYNCRNKPSGISISTARYWAIFEPKDTLYTLYIIPSKIIKKYIENKKYHRDCKGGDDHASKLYLFKKELFKDYIVYSNIYNNEYNNK